MTVAAPTELDLTFTASGATQHVFVSTHEPSDGWVYKTPAILDALLPSPVTWRTAVATRGWKRAVLAACVDARRRLETHDGERPVRLRTLARHGLQRTATLADRCVDHAWAVRHRSARLRQFQRMCLALRELACGPASDVVLPFRILHARCTLRVDGRAHQYAGPVLQQRRADHFFDFFTGFALFRWADVAEGQHRLWRCGVGLVDTDEILGPRNWALLDGRLHLADTGSLTTDLALARRAVAAELLDAREAQIPVWWPASAGEPLAEYFAFVRRDVGEARLGALWGLDRARRDCSERSTPRLVRGSGTG
ncbi:hypothetical protein [Roseisolibacter agri]|uniref:Uncharacterized protein n=1 Tax=Roseisolibacter agri TaxID=2014610 RepID=A0AA37QD96_9BACT|nr:hypothetical protein [Roseisolibacter agri]GLC24588.1 hypothetical protein rosag_11010 [Roseisolibacter agri]